MGIVNPRGGTTFVAFDPSNPTVNATFSSASLEVIPTTGSRTLYDLGAQAVRVLISGSHSAASLQIRGITESINVHIGSTAGTLRVGDIPGSIAVYFSPANPAVSATFSGSLAVVPITGSGHKIYEEVGDSIRVNIVGSQTAASLQVIGITNSIAVHVLSTNGTMAVNVGKTDGTVTVRLDPGYELGSIKAINSSVSINPFTPAGVSMSDEGYDAQRVIIAGTHAAASIEIKGTLTGVTNSIAVHLLSTGGTIKVGIDPGYNIVNTSSTIILPRTVSDSASGVSASGNTLISPVTSRVIKVYAIALTTTAQVQTVVSFGDGGGAGSRFWRYALQAPAQGIAGANLAVTPPGYIFATASGSTLSLHLDNASLVHYSIGYFLESA